MVSNLDGILWLLLLLGPLLLLQRKVHFEIQAILLLMTRRMDIVFVLFSLIFLPGVLIHELSHYLLARLVGVRTGKFSIIPRRLDDGRLQLGYVETATSDILRDSIIGVAPLIMGGLVITLIARFQMGFDTLAESLLSGEISIILDSLKSLIYLPDFWLWFYLVFTISSTMLPSASDRRAWLPLAIVIFALLIIGLFFGIGPWVVSNLAPAVNKVFQSLAIVFGISVLTHFLLAVPLLLIRMGLSKVTQVHLRP
jgi:hypothetical protein